MTQEILIPSKTYSREVAMIFRQVKEIGHHVDVRHVVRPSFV